MRIARVQCYAESERATLPLCDEPEGPDSQLPQGALVVSSREVAALLDARIARVEQTVTESAEASGLHGLLERLQQARLAKSKSFSADPVLKL